MKHDAAELYRLSELTERCRVKDILIIEAKKLETEISKLQETEGLLAPSLSSQTIPAKRTYDVKLNTYGLYKHNLFFTFFGGLKLNDSIFYYI